MDSPDMEIEDDNYEPVKNTKSLGKKDNLNNSKTENTVSITSFLFYINRYNLFYDVGTFCITN